MKLLLDENLSYRILPAIDDLYPGSKHVRDVGLLGATDAQVWAFAIANSFLLVSKDIDFYQRSLVEGSPPKVIWLRLGNALSRVVVQLLRDRHATGGRFSDSPDASFLALTLP